MKTLHNLLAEAQLLRKQDIWNTGSKLILSYIEKSRVSSSEAEELLIRELEAATKDVASKVSKWEPTHKSRRAVVRDLVENNGVFFLRGDVVDGLGLDLLNFYYNILWEHIDLLVQLNREQFTKLMMNTAYQGELLMGILEILCNTLFIEEFKEAAITSKRTITE